MAIVRVSEGETPHLPDPDLSLSLSLSLSLYEERQVTRRGRRDRRSKMKKKLSTRFPASRIKKIMQADEDVGKIALAVPILVSKALELFLQDLCDRTYEITLQRGARTVSSSHLKHCIHMYSEFDFLRESVNKIPGIGGSDPMGIERNGTRRRKVLTNGDCDTMEEGKRAKAVVLHHVGRGGRGRGRGRGRGARGSKISEECVKIQKYEDDLGMCPDDNDEQPIKTDKPEDQVEEKENTGCANGMAVTGGTNDGVGPKELRQPPENKMEANNEYMGWPFYDIANIGIEPAQLFHLNKKSEPEEEEDYDNYEE